MSATIKVAILQWQTKVHAAHACFKQLQFYSQWKFTFELKRSNSICSFQFCLVDITQYRILNVEIYQWKPRRITAHVAQKTLILNLSHILSCLMPFDLYILRRQSTQTAHVWSSFVFFCYGGIYYCKCKYFRKIAAEYLIVWILTHCSGFWCISVLRCV